jgi:putative RecB family exonuclease
MNEEKPHLSYSQIQCYITCPLKYRFSYVDGLEPEFTPATLHFGSAMHQAVAAFLNSTLNGDRLTADNMTDVWRAAWRGNGEQIRYFGKEDENLLTKKAGELLSIYHDYWNHDIEVLAVEEFFAFDLAQMVPDSLDPLPDFVGYIDSIEKSVTGEITVVDLKTAARKPSLFQIQNNAQLAAYGLGAAKSLGFNPDELKYRLDYLMKTPTPDLISFNTTRNQDDMHRFLKTITMVWRGVKQSVFYPKPDYYCGTCQWQTHCSEW